MRTVRQPESQRIVASRAELKRNRLRRLAFALRRRVPVFACANTLRHEERSPGEKSAGTDLHRRNGRDARILGQLVILGLPLLRLCKRLVEYHAPSTLVRAHSKQALHRPSRRFRWQCLSTDPQPDTQHGLSEGTLATGQHSQRQQSAVALSCAEQPKQQHGWIKLMKPAGPTHRAGRCARHGSVGARNNQLSRPGPSARARARPCAGP